MDMRVGGVHKALVSAGDVTDKNNVVILTKFGSFAAHDPTTRQLTEQRHLHQDSAVQKEWHLHFPCLVP